MFTFAYHIKKSFEKQQGPLKKKSQTLQQSFASAPAAGWLNTSKTLQEMLFSFLST